MTQCRGGTRPILGGVSEFGRVIKANFALSLQPLINISFPKSVGEGGVQHEKNFPNNIFVHLILRLTTIVRSIFP